MGGTVCKTGAAGTLTAAKGMLTAVFHFRDIFALAPGKSSHTLVDIGIKADCAGIMDCIALRLEWCDFFLALVTPFFLPCINFKLRIGQGNLQSPAVTSEYLQTAGTCGDYPANAFLLQELNFSRKLFKKIFLFAQVMGWLVTTVQQYAKIGVFLAQGMKQLQGLLRPDSRQRTAWKENRGAAGGEKSLGKHGRAPEFFKKAQRQVLLESALIPFNREPAKLKKHLGHRKLFRTASSAEFAQAAGIGRMEMPSLSFKILSTNLTRKTIALQKRTLVDASAAAKTLSGNQFDHVAIILLSGGYSPTLVLIKIYMSCHLFPSEF
jgi:hypothetical protein